MTPPRQPRRRMSSSCGGRRLPVSLPSPETCRLEIEEYTGGPSQTVVRGFLVLFDVEVQSPSGADPLSPGGGDGVLGKICGHAECRPQSRGRTDDFVTFMSPLVAEPNEAFLIVAVAGGDELGACENVSGAGMSPYESALEHDGITEVVGGADLGAPVVVGGFALIETAPGIHHQLPAGKKPAIDDCIEPILGKKETTDAASSRELYVPVRRQRTNHPQTAEPTAIAETGFTREFSGESVLAARDQAPSIEVVPV